MSFVGARISSIIILSLANELRLSVLDLSELKERRLHVTTQPRAAGNNKWRAGEHNKQKARNPLLHATSREPAIYLVDKKVQWRIERGVRVCSRTRIRYCSRLLRDGNVSEVSLFALRDRRKEEEQNTERRLLSSFPYEAVVSVQHDHGCNYMYHNGKVDWVCVHLGGECLNITRRLCAELTVMTVKEIRFI